MDNPQAKARMKEFFDNMPNPDAVFQSWWPFIIAGVAGLLYGFRSWFKGPKCVGGTKLNGKTAIITGANSGIGRAYAVDFARKGARVIMACRNETAGREAMEEVRKEAGSVNVVFMTLDLASFKSIRTFVDKFNEKEEKLHLLMNNGGVNMCTEEKSDDKFELQFAVNYLGMVLLTELLLDKLKASAPSRIINTTAPAANLGLIHFDNINLKGIYTPGVAFAQSKCAVILYTLYLAEKLKETKVTVNVVNPGVVNSNAHRHMPFKTSTFIRISFAPFVWFMMKTPDDGAQTGIYCATAEDMEGVTGKYYKDCQEKAVEESMLNKELQEKLYKASLEWTKTDKED